MASSSINLVRDDKRFREGHSCVPKLLKELGQGQRKYIRESVSRKEVEGCLQHSKTSQIVRIGDTYLSRAISTGKQESQRVGSSRY